MIGLPLAPFPVTYRELWLPPSISDHAILPTSVEGGHGLTLTGARKGTTVDGVHFYGDAASNISCGNIFPGDAKHWVSFRFKLDQGYDAASAADQYLWGKVGATYIYLRLISGDGRMSFYTDTGGAASLGITGQNSWNAKQWYHVLASVSDVNGSRFRIDGGGNQGTGNMNGMPPGGAYIIGDRIDPGAGTGFKGVIADVFCGNDDLITAEEDDLAKGIPPADARNVWLLDEGRGVTAVSRGLAANNGTLDTSCTWAFGQVQQPVISLDGIDDHGVSSAGVNISGDLTFVWVGKMKSTYDGLVTDHYLAHLFVDVNNELRVYYDNAADALRFHAEGGGTAQTVDYTTRPTIDDYIVLLLTLTNAGVLAGFVNGSLIGTAIGVGAIGGAATAYFGAEQTPSLYDISKPLLVALIDGAFTQQEARTYSRYLKNIFNLPIVI